MTTSIGASVKRSSALVGVVGEYLAAEHLRELGWTVPDEFGGARRHYDLCATAGGRAVQVSVKTTTHPHGAITWQRPGTATVAPWIAAAAAAGQQAVLLALHVEPPAAVQAVDGGFFFSTPRVLEVGALTAAEWGQIVDERRAAYAATPRKDGTGLLSPSGLRYPLNVDELDWVQNVLDSA